MIVTYVARSAPTRPPPACRCRTGADRVAYGRYMAEAMDCVGCHTDGLQRRQVRRSERVRRRLRADRSHGRDDLHQEHHLRRGDGHRPLVGRRLRARGARRRDARRIRGAQADAAVRAARARRRRGDLRLPEDDAEGAPAEHSRAAIRCKRAQANDAPEVLFVNLGCAGCHGDNAPHRDRIRAALGKPDADVAAWILDPQAQKPGSPCRRSRA